MVLEQLATWMRRLAGVLVIAALTGCGYNDFQKLDEDVKGSWSEVLNQYQRRADLIPNVVATVKGEANFEQETLTKVVEARAKATAAPAPNSVGMSVVSASQTRAEHPSCTT